MSGPREWSPRPIDKKVLELKAKIEKWLKDNDVSTDAHVYTAKEWNERGEQYGGESVLTIAAEGAFYRVMNYAESWSDKVLQKKFLQFLEKMGLWYEQGYAWTWHLYPTSEAKMGEAVARKPLLTVLSAIRFTQPKMVLMQGRTYFRIEELVDQARRDMSNSPEARQALEAPIYSSETGPDGKLVIWRDVSGGRKATFVEPGSVQVTDP